MREPIGTAATRQRASQVMRALSHPTRTALYELLAFYGPMTATEAAARIGVSPSACSFHLRHMERLGLVVDAGGGAGRNRPWRLVEIGFSLDDDDLDGPGRTAGQVLGETLLQRQMERHLSSSRRAHQRGEPWDSIDFQAQTVMWLAPGEAGELRQRVADLMLRFHDRLLDPSTRPPDAQPVEVVVLAHLFDEATQRSTGQADHVV